MSDYLFDQRLAHGVPDFSKFDPENLLPSTYEARTRAQERLSQITDNTDLPTFENTLLALGHHARELDYLEELYSMMQAVKKSDALSEAGKEFEKITSDYSTGILTSAPLFERIKFLHDNADRLDLNGQQKALLDKKFRDFSENGALLSDNDKEILKDLNAKISLAKTQYSENIVNAVKTAILPVADDTGVAGLAEDIVAAAAKKAKDLGLSEPYALTIDAQTCITTLETCSNRDTRRALFLLREEATQKEPYDNNVVARELIELRHKRADLLGKANHAEQTLQGRMVDTVEKANDFIGKLIKSSHIAEQEELKTLRAFAKAQDGIEDLQEWDVRYYMNQVQKADGLDPEEVRAYLSVDNTLKAAIALHTRLFGLDFRKTDAYPTYAPDMEVYEIRSNPEQPEPTAIMLMDLYARKGEKRGGAWVNPLLNRNVKEDGTVQIPVFSINTNYIREPDGKPTYLRFFDYCTMFHEFGHGLHAALTEIDYREISGINVAWDFVELPSMTLEKWAAEPEILSIAARHKDTGAPMPDDMMKELKGRGQEFPGIFLKRQAFFSALDMACYTTDPKAIGSLEDFENDVRTSVGGTAFERSSTHRFSHIFAGGYAAGYYSYFWADTLAWDAFAVFEKEGLFNRSTANSFQKNILAKGASEKPEDLYMSFAGHMPNVNSLFKALKLPLVGENGQETPKRTSVPSVKPTPTI